MAKRQRAARDVLFGFSEWPADGTERAAQMEVGVSGDATADPAQNAGLAILNDDKYGTDVSGGMVRMTVLRCPPYAYRGPPHVADWRAAEVVKRARELKLALPAITMHINSGSLPKSASLDALTNSNIELTAFKLAEDCDGYIVRVEDRHRRPSRGLLVRGRRASRWRLSRSRWSRCGCGSATAGGKRRGVIWLGGLYDRILGLIVVFLKVDGKG